MPFKVLYSQELVCPDADKSTFLVNPSSKVQEPLFVFYESDDEPVDPAEVTCNLLPNLDSSVITWFQFDPVDSVLNVLGAADTGVVSLKTDLGEGEYILDIRSLDGGVDTQMVFRIYHSSFSAKIFKDFDGRAIQATFCDAIKLVSNAEYDTLFYFDFNDTTRYERVNVLDSMSWEISFIDEVDNQFTGLEGMANVDARTISPPPMEDVNVILTLVDEFGHTVKDSADYIAIAVRAEFEVEELFITDPTLYDNFEDKQFYADYYSSPTASAPHRVRFENQSSSKVEEYEWRFGDGNRSEFSDSTIHTYEYPGEYRPILKVANGNCEDEIEGELIDVNKQGPVLEFPNLMVIGGVNSSGNAFLFRSHDISVRDFKIVIFNRWGIKVHDFKGDDIRDWKGWDGTNKETGTFVESGVYFYAVKFATAFDENKKEKNFRNSQKNGFVHIYNANQ